MILDCAHVSLSEKKNEGLADNAIIFLVSYTIQLFQKAHFR